MLPNVWSVEEFKRQSNKSFSRRSSQLQAIDRTLGIAHRSNPATDSGAAAIVDVLQAITTWRQLKQAQGKTSGRARAVDTLHSQIAAAAEAIYKRRIDQVNMTAPWVENKAIREVHDPRVAMERVREGFKQHLPKTPTPGSKPLPPIPPKPPGGRKPLPPTPSVPLPKRTPSQDRLFDYLAQSMIDRRQRVMAYDDEDLFDDLDARQQGRLAARWMLSVPDSVTDIPAARGEALRVLAAMLGNDVSVIKSLLENRIEVVVIPRDQGMTVLDQFESIRGELTFDGRSWDSVRGVGNVDGPTPMGPHRPPSRTGKGAGSIVAIDPGKNKIYTAITEENLLGGTTTAPGGGCYDTGYSTTTHEFAHSVHAYGISDADRRVIQQAYDMKLRQPATEQWVDGPRMVGAQSCYASMTVYEYFAQLTNAWLGVNFGPDPYTGAPRNNGKQWVLDHEPRMVSDIFERIYGSRALEDLNPAVLLKS